MSDPDDQPTPRSDVIQMHGAEYWLRVARAALGPRKSRPTAARPVLRAGMDEQAGFDRVYPVYGPEEP